MKYYLLIIKFLFILIITWSIACKKNSTSTKNQIWKAIGFEDKLAIRLVLSEPYLYICAGSNGLWRLNIRDSGNYQCLGLIDTSLGNYYNRGVQDVLIHPDNPDWLLVSFLPDKGKDHGVFSSIDVGNTWTAADSGLQVNYGGELGYKRIYRFLFYNEYIIGAGEGIYFTNNFAKNWVQQNTPPGVSGQVLERHNSDKSIIWLGGESLVFSPLLSYSTDSASTWIGIGLSSYGVPVDNAVYSISLDPFNPQIVYVGMQGMIIKTNDSGQNWQIPLVTNQNGEWFRAIESDPRNQKHLLASAGRTILETNDAGKSWQEIQSPIEFQILDILWDDVTQSVYFATEQGIFQLIM